MKYKKPTKAQMERQVRLKRLQTETHLGMRFDEWRLKKRQEWLAVKSALERFSYGCAYTPAGNDLYELQRAADRIARAMADDWVSW